MESSRYSHGGWVYRGAYRLIVVVLTPPNDVRTRNKGIPRIIRALSGQSTVERREEKTITANKRGSRGGGEEKTRRGWSTDVGGGGARKRGLQEFNLDEFLLATY